MADVKFVDDIPKIAREGFTRGSKYEELLDACVSNAGKAARMDFDSQGKASSRATSIKNAASNHSATKNDEGRFIVATRSNDDDTEFYVYTKFVAAGSDEYDEVVERERKAAEQPRKPRKKKAKKKQDAE